MTKIFLRSLMPIFLVSLIYNTTYSQDDVELENKIRRAKKEIEQLESERNKINQAAKEDLKQFKEYQQRTNEKIQRLKQKNDSLNQVSAKLRENHSKLGATVNSIKSRQQEFDYYQQNVKDVLARLCDTLLKVTEDLPPQLSEKNSASIKFLKSEIQVNTSDNIESMNRLFSILTELDNRLMSIEVEQGTSPLPDISGVVYRLRIGGVFESIVNESGNQSAIWDAKEKKWHLIDDDQITANIHKAVSIRIGKSVPELVTLPLSLNNE